jgi:hypothetical protein
MPNDQGQTFWNSVFAQVQDWVSRENEESGPHLRFETKPNWFRVSRVLSFLAVERWLADNRIEGRSEIKGQSGRKMMPTIFATLTITGKNEAWLPQDPLTEPVAVTVDDVVRRVIGLFQQSGGPVASIHSGLAQARKAAGRPADEVFDDLEREGAGG